MPTKESILRKSEEAIKELEASSPTDGSVEWYALNNLRRFREQVEDAKSVNEVGEAQRRLSRFAVDALDWNSSLSTLLNAVETEAHAYCAQAHSD